MPAADIEVAYIIPVVAGIDTLAIMNVNWPIFSEIWRLDIVWNRESAQTIGDTFFADNIRKGIGQW